MAKVYYGKDAKLSYLKLGEDIISYQIYLSYRDQSMWFDISYDREHREYRPGIIQYDIGLSESYKNSSFRNILGWGDDQHKLGFCNNFFILHAFILKGNRFLSIIWYYLQKINYTNTEKIFDSTILPKLTSRKSKIRIQTNG